MKKKINEEIKRMQVIAGIIKEDGDAREIDKEEEEEDAMEEYQSKSTESFTIGDLEYMDNDELIAVLQRIKEVYSNPELDNMDSAGVANHIGMAIELIKKRISN